MNEWKVSSAFKYSRWLEQVKIFPLLFSVRGLVHSGESYTTSSAPNTEKSHSFFSASFVKTGDKFVDEHK